MTEKLMKEGDLDALSKSAGLDPAKIGLMVSAQ
jgi:hypothetical protein